MCGCGRKEPDRISMDHYRPAESTVQETEDTQTDEESQEADAVTTPVEEQEDTDIYLVVSVDTQTQMIGLALPDSARTVQYGYTSATQIFDNFGQFMSVNKLQPGRAVTIGELDSQAKLTTIRLAKDAWYQENITRYEIDPSIKMFTIGDTKYHYGQYLRVFAGEQEISLMQVGVNDVISVQGIGKEIVSVQVTTGHGTIALLNTELFEGGWISLGTKIYAKVTPNMILEVPEGKYELSVANDGYGDSKTIVVERAKVTKVDLEQYKGEGPKLCQVTFEIYVDDALLYIDGENVDYDEPVELRYGVHQLTVIAEGFETWERQLVIHSEEATIQIGEPELSEGTEDEESDDSEESTSTNQRDDDADEEDEDAESETYTSEEKGASNTSSDDSEDYEDYLDTIVDLIQSLTTTED